MPHRIFIRFLALTFFLTLFLPAGNALAQNSCPDPGTSFSVKKVRKKIKFDRSSSMQDLTQIHSGSVHMQGPAILGVAGGPVGVGMNLQFKTYRNSAGTLNCISLESAEGLFIAFPKISLASGLRKGTCEYNAVLEHEKEHIRILMQFQDQYAPKFKSHLKKILRQYGQPKVVSAVSAKHAMMEMRQQIENAAGAYFNEIAPILSKRQQEIDTAESYAKVFKKCSNWSQASAPRYKRRY